MKKLLFLLAAIAILGFAGCKKTTDSDGGDANEIWFVDYHPGGCFLVFNTQKGKVCIGKNNVVGTFTRTADGKSGTVTISGNVDFGGMHDINWDAEPYTINGEKLFLPAYTAIDREHEYFFPGKLAPAEYLEIEKNFLKTFGWN